MVSPFGLHYLCSIKQIKMKISKIWFADDRIYGLTDDGRELWQKQDNNFIAPPSDYGRWGFFCAYLSL